MSQHRSVHAIYKLISNDSQDKARYRETLIVSGNDRTVCLNDHKIELGACGLEVGDALEVYQPMLERWFPLRWATIVGPFTSVSGNSLFLRRSEVYQLRDFPLLQPIASYVPQLSNKGKERAF